MFIAFRPTAFAVGFFVCDSFAYFVPQIKKIAKMTLRGIASERGVDVTSLKRKLRRAGIEPPKTNDEPLEQSVVDLLTTDKRKAKQSGGIVATLKKDFETPIKMPEIQENPQPSHQNGSQAVHSHTEDEKGRQNVPKRLISKSTPKIESSTLQKKLSADWLIVLVLVVILFADMFAFGSIGHHGFGKRIRFAALFFSVIGLATGIGSVVTYNRIKDLRTAEIWKWCFGVMQFCVFLLAINEEWFWAEMIMTSMFVLVFIGVQRSIKK